jgi:uncharacterized protein YbjT (DUF2867 family)
MVEIKAQKIILVTGATGYIGSQIVNHLVQEKKFENYIIRCAVRDPENMSKIEPLKTFFTPEQFARLEMFKVDLLEHASIDKAVEGC